MSTTRPETLAFLERAPLLARAQRELPATRERVFDALADAEGWERWFPGMRRCEWLTPAPHGVGSLREVTVGGLRILERFVVWDHPRRWGFTFLEARPAFTRAGVELVELEELPGHPTATASPRSRVTYTMALQPPGPLGALATALAGPMEARLSEALEGLAHHLTTPR